jgi:hypothetical protein
VSSLEAVLRYDSAVVMRGRRDGEPQPCAIQPRDLEIVDGVRRHKFLTSPQLLEIWWPGRAPQVGRRRLTRLFEAGLLDRFRPVASRGSFPWTYQLGREGHRMLQDAGLVPRGKRFEVQTVYDYRYVLHELHLNAWVLAWRRLLGPNLVTWTGETLIDPPSGLGKPPLYVGEDVTVDDLNDTQAKQLRPDDVIEVARDDGSLRTFFIEYDRTRRVDKNFEKFRRYDAFLCWWWRWTSYGSDSEPPMVIFVCQDIEHCELFLKAADHELTGHHWRPSETPVPEHFIGRRKIVFATEADMHDGDAVAYRVPAYPPGVLRRDDEDALFRRGRLPGRTDPA